MSDTGGQLPQLNEEERAARILVVEDQRLIAADIEGTLGRLGYTVVGSVASGEEAVTIAGETLPQLVLMDIRLAGSIDGVEAAKRIRDRFGTPVVFLTAYADEETLARAKTTAPYGYLVKPFNERELRAAIEVAFFTHRMEGRLAEERVRGAAAEQFKLLVESVESYALVMLDAQGVMVTWNSGAERITGYRADEIIGKHISVFYTEEDRLAKHPEQVLQAALAGGRWEAEGWRVRKDGTRFWASVVTHPVFDLKGNLRGYAKVIRDLTERKEAEAKQAQLVRDLRHAVQARDEFMQIASHELKTPLTPLMLQVDLLTKLITAQNERLVANLETVSRQTRRLSRLVDTLLDISRISAGRVSLQFEELDLSRMLRELIERYTNEANAAGSDIRLHAEPAVVGRWDRLRLEQIVSNLLSNAIKYGAGHPIDVEVAGSDGLARLVVTDHGIGIAEEALERIFERFERAVPTRSYGGLGLGLFIARQLAEAHGGTITARSSPGEGTTFTVLLPREPHVPGSAELNQPPEPH